MPPSDHQNLRQQLEQLATQRAGQLCDHIAETLTLLRQYEEAERLEDEPRRLANIHHNIKREKEALARYRAEAEDLLAAATTPALPSPLPHNPFFVGGRITHTDYFFGRQRPLRELRQELQKRSNVSLVGASQIGKSSLLYHLYQSRAAWLPHSTVAYIDLQGVLDEADFCETMLAVLGQTGDDLRQLKRVLSGQDVVLLLDEIERLADPDFNPRLHHLLRSLSQESQLAFCVASQQPLEVVFAPPPGQKLSPFHNVFVSQRVGPFSAAEARELLTVKMRPFPHLFTADDIERLLVQSDGHPARLQAAAHQLFRERTG